MRDSNWTLRWPRTSREVYGHDIQFEENNPDQIVWWVTVFAIGFICGVIFV
jgi:hypothetical protein